MHLHTVSVVWHAPVSRPVFVQLHMHRMQFKELDSSLGVAASELPL